MRQFNPDFLFAGLRRLLCLAAALMLFAGILLPAACAEEDDTSPADTVYLRSPQDFAEFAANCVLDTYSQNKVFILQTDVDLSEISFSPVQLFSGTFDGNGHSISSLLITGEGSRQGLFRRVGEGAEIHDLKVSGTVTPAGSAEYVGGIAGENAGFITGCSFEGTVKGSQFTGGIAGSNLGTGLISSCSFSGELSCKKDSGGIAGSNAGIIMSCQNSGEICAGPIDADSDTGLSDFDITTFDVSQITTENFVNISNIGGITGSNSGTVQSSKNSGTVGYMYQGYNVGGIAGRSAGYISLCENSGSVFAQSDSGGIVGQLEPCTSLELGEDLLDEIKGHIALLNTAASSLSDSMQSSASAGSSKVSEMAGYADAIAAELEKLDLKEAIPDLPNLPDLPDLPDTPGDDEGGDEGGGSGEDLPTDAFDIGVLSDNLSAMYSSAAGLASVLGSTASSAATGAKNVMAQITAISNILSTALQNAGNTSITAEDISVKEAYTSNTGAVANCSNRGNVSADKNAGGIAGVCSVELSFDIAGELNLSDWFLSSATATFFAVVRDCESSCEVTVRDSFAGGTAGRMSIGAVINCSFDGTASALQGDYAGGIVGLSEGSVNDCTAKAALSCGKYAGGITGLGCNLSGNLAFTSVESATEYAGAVAGDATGVLENNLYVDCGIGAVDGASYAGQAEPISYEEAGKIEGVPDYFLPITVIFVAEDRAVAKFRVPFDGSLYEYPAVSPDADGSAWQWDEYTHEHIRSGFTVYGARLDPVPVISTGEELPLFLAEGRFTASNKLTAENYDGSGVVPDLKIKPQISSTITVEGVTGPVKLHMRAKDGGILYIVHNGSCARTDYTPDGSYLVFPLESGDSVVYCAQSERAGVLPPVLIGSAAVLGTVSFLLIRKKKKAVQNAPQSSSEGNGET